MKTKILAALMGLMLAAVPLAAQQKATSSDETILANAIRVVQYNVHYTVYDNVELAVTNGVVVMTGQVTDPYKKSTFENAILKRVEGVKSVENKLEVLPVSSNDSRIRYFVVRNIYNDSRMLRYSLESFPRAIHVIVKRGTVTLEGKVANRMDSRIAELRAREVFGVLSVKNNLQVGA
jgi:osmotically-inducible protein OsmY